MKQLRCVGVMLLVMIAFYAQGCAAELTPEQKQLVADLKHELERIRQEIEEATREDAAYSGGLIKSLIRMRLQVLKTNEALVEQRIHALESGARITLVVNATKPDPGRAAELAKEIESQRAKVAEARAEADRYSGGLVQAMAEAAVATNRSTLALLEQQYLIAKYGLAVPALSAESPAAAGAKPKATPVSRPASPTATASNQKGAGDCLKIETFDSSILS